MNALTPEKENANIAVTPEKLIQLGLGFFASKVFLSALKFDLFTELSGGPLLAGEIRARLGLHPRGVLDFLDALSSLGVLVLKDGAYGNSPETQVYFNRRSQYYVGHMLEMANDRLYEFWGRLEEALMTGKPQNETRGGKDFFEVIYADPEKRNLFLKAMIGLSAGSSAALVQKYNFGQHRVFCDLGGGPGTLSALVAGKFPDLEIINFDLPPAEEVFNEYISRQGLTEKVRFASGDCLQDPLPPADLYVMGHVLHGWGSSPETHRMLSKVHKSLPPGGKLIVVESFIDPERSLNTFGLLMSLDMLIETPSGRNFTAPELQEWMQGAGFKNVLYEPLAGPHGMLIGEKEEDNSHGNLN